MTPKENYTKDAFWKWYTIIVMIMAIMIAAAFFLIYRARSETSDDNADSVAIAMQKLTKNDNFRYIESPMVYKDALSYGWEQWSWYASVNTNWKSSHGTEIKTVISEPWGGVQFASPRLSAREYNSLEFDYSQNGSSHVYVSFVSKEGAELGRQPVSWYVIREGERQHVVLPLRNFNAQTTLSGFSLLSDGPIEIVIDNIRFSTTINDKPMWQPPPAAVEIPTETFLPIILPYIHNFSGLGNWKTQTGKISLGQDHTLILEPNTAESTALVLLGGSENWRDYEFTTTIDWGQGESVSLIARAVSPDNYVSCLFGYNANSAAIYVQKFNQNSAVAQSPEFPVPIEMAWKDVRIGVRAVGSTIECLINGESVLRAQIDKPQSGGVGIETWDRQGHRVVIKDIRVNLKD
ncbi:MAG TPA: hypothetical protein VI981_04415 [Candidatus Paceibacterota bacterium]